MAACSALGTSYQQRSMPSRMQCLPATAGRLEPNERLKHEKQPFREQHRFRQSCQRFFVSVYCTDFAHTGPKGEHQMSTQGYSAGQDPQDKRNEQPRHGLAICLQFVHEMFHTHTSGSVNSSIRSYTLTLIINMRGTTGWRYASLEENDTDKGPLTSMKPHSHLHPRNPTPCRSPSIAPCTRATDIASRQGQDAAEALVSHPAPRPPPSHPLIVCCAGGVEMCMTPHPEYPDSGLGMGSGTTRRRAGRLMSGRTPVTSCDTPPSPLSLPPELALLPMLAVTLPPPYVRSLLLLHALARLR